MAIILWTTKVLKQEKVEELGDPEIEKDINRKSSEIRPKSLADILSVLLFSFDRQIFTGFWY